MVLLKNLDNVLPLGNGEKVVLFGQASVNYIKGGGGSGDVFCDYVRNVYDGFAVKEAEQKVLVFKGLEEFYRQHVDKEKIRIKNAMENDLPPIYKIRDMTEKGLRFGEFII